MLSGQRLRAEHIPSFSRRQSGRPGPRRPHHDSLHGRISMGPRGPPGRRDKGIEADAEHRLAQRSVWRQRWAAPYGCFDASKEEDKSSRLRSALADAGADESACNDEGHTTAEVDALETRRMLERRAESEERRREAEEIRRMGYGRSELRERELRRRMAAAGPEGQPAGHGRGGPCRTLPP